MVRPAVYALALVFGQCPLFTVPSAEWEVTGVFTYSTLDRRDAQLVTYTAPDGLWKREQTVEGVVRERLQRSPLVDGCRTEIAQGYDAGGLLYTGRSNDVCE
jgi:hypothetical protein